MALLRNIYRRIRGYRAPPPAPRLPKAPAPRTHVVLLDGTMSSLKRGFETNIGLTYRLLQELGPEHELTLYYEPGIQWRGLRRASEVIAGVGINRQIMRAYLFLARNYRPGDRIFLMGYSRGAYAVRSLAGLIDTLGLLKSAQVNEAALERLYHLYRTAPDGAEAQAFRARCHERVAIDMVGVYDTVRALGFRWPFVAQAQPFHNHRLGPIIRQGRHALAMDETRAAFKPVLWDVPEERRGEIVQMWFRGSHGDIGGQLDGWRRGRPLSNIPLVWMLSEAEACGLALPRHWRSRFLTDAKAPSVGNSSGWGRIFLRRRRRVIGRDPSERIHPSAMPRARSAGMAFLPDGRFGWG